jgi:phage portal protein BeeE
MLPTNLHRQLPSGDVEKATEHNVHRLLRKRPNGWQTPLQFKSYMQGRAILYGNAYAFKVRDPLGFSRWSRLIHAALRRS